MTDSYSIEFRAMGCRVEIQLETDEDGLKLLNNLPSELEHYEMIMSRFRNESELSHLNRQAGEWLKVSETLFAVVQQAKHGARRTDGLYNPLILHQMIANGYGATFESLHQPAAHSTSPALSWRDIGLRPKTNEVFLPLNSAIDLGGIAKGWVSAKIADKLSQWGACLVNIGGDITVRGAPLGLDGWEIEIDDPITGYPLTSLYLKDTTIITSGIDYRRWTTSDGVHKHHIIDPNTGLPAITDVLTISIIHPDASSAEVFGKAVLLMQSDDGLKWLHQHWRTQALIVRQDGCVMASANFASIIRS
jgi:FAD:protein FMN transferase